MTNIWFRGLLMDENFIPQTSFAVTLSSSLVRMPPTSHHAEKIPGENRELVVPELGVYRFDKLIVLRTTKMPAALLECGVIINPAEEEELKEPERQMKVVRAVRAAVLSMAVERPANAESP